MSAFFLFFIVLASDVCILCFVCMYTLFYCMVCILLFVDTRSIYTLVRVNNNCEVCILLVNI